MSSFQQPQFPPIPPVAGRHSHMTSSLAMPSPANSQHGHHQPQPTSQPTSQPMPPMQSKSSAVHIASLISPPQESPYESFSHGPQSSTTKPSGYPAQQPSSPPVSPWKSARNQVTTFTTGRETVDPPLYLEEPTGPAPPLFSAALSSEMIDGHIAAVKANPLPLPQGVKPPTREDYELLGEARGRFIQVFPSWFSNYHTLQTNEERTQYLEARRAETKADDKARKEHRHPPTQRRNDYAAFRPASSTKPKPLLARPLRPTSSSDSSSSGHAIIEYATGPRNTAKVTKPVMSREVRTTTAPSRLEAYSSTATTLVQRKPANKKTTKTGKPQVSDTDFRHIPDYSPPLTSLDGKIMKYLSTAKPRDFTQDDMALLHLLHPLEQELARREQLSAASYLTTKRRIFVDRLYFYHHEKKQRAKQEQLAKQGQLGKKEQLYEKRFLKTHAQEAAKIDVNKTSRLHTAFESVGWLEPKWCANHPEPTFDNKRDREFTAEDIIEHGPPGPHRHLKKGIER